MTRICCACNKNLGKKEPLEDTSETSTYCDECYKIHFPECALCSEPTEGRALCPSCDNECG